MLSLRPTDCWVLKGRFWCCNFRNFVQHANVTRRTLRKKRRFPWGCPFSGLWSYVAGWLFPGVSKEFAAGDTFLRNVGTTCTMTQQHILQFHRWTNLECLKADSHWNFLRVRGIFMKTYIWVFSKIFRKNHVSLKSDKNDGYFIRRRVYIYNNSLNTSYNGKCFRQKVVEKITTSILCWIIFLSNSYLLWNNLESYDTADQAAEGNMTHALCLLDN